MAKVVETDLPDLGPWPQLHVALWAASQICVLGLFGVPAALATAGVAVTVDDAGTAERGSEQLLQRGLHRHHGTVGVGKHQIGRRAADRDFQVRHQLRGNRYCFGVPALGGFPRVGVADADEPALKIDVQLAQSEQLTLAKPGVDGGREQRPPLVHERSQHPGDLVHRQERGKALRHAPPPDIDDGILRNLARTTGGAEHSAQECPQMVHGLRRKLAGLRLNELLHATGRDLVHAQLGDVRAQEMLAKRAAALRVRGRLAKILVLPPAQEIAEDDAGIGSSGLQPEPAAFGLPFQIEAETLGLGLGLG